MSAPRCLLSSRRRGSLANVNPKTCRESCKNTLTDLERAVRVRCSVFPPASEVLNAAHIHTIAADLSNAIFDVLAT